jgi:hypothetical protein
VNPLDFLPVAVVLLLDFCVAFFALIVPSCAGSPMSYFLGLRSARVGRVPLERSFYCDSPWYLRTGCFFIS